MPYCPTCVGPCQTETDDALGHVVCTACGSVLEENAIVSQIEFNESSGVQGLSISNGAARQRSSGKFSTAVSSERVLENGNQIISQIAVGLHFSQRHIQSAQRFFALSVSHAFNKGRRTQVLCAACLYIVCRVEKTAHLLIDFADSLQVNVYVLGATFLRLVQILFLDLPLVDPALYIARYAAKLDFKEKTQKVITDSLRLVQRMNRDWIQTGRRPAGICAAALFVASRMSGFQRSRQEIIFTVKVCEQTLMARLEDIKNTPSGQLSVHDFNTLWLEESADPPAFKNVAKRRRGSDQAVDDEEDPFADSDAAKAIREEDDDPFAFEEDVQKEFVEDEDDDPFAEDVTQVEVCTIAQEKGDEPVRSEAEEEEDPFFTTPSTLVGTPLQTHDDEDPFALDALTQKEESDLTQEIKDYLLDPEVAVFVDEFKISAEDQDDLLDLDDDPEVANAILEDREREFKQAIWMDENSDWVERQKGRVVREVKKKRVKKAKAEEGDEDEPPKAVLSKKINYEVLDSLFDD